MVGSTWVKFMSSSGKDVIVGILLGEIVLESHKRGLLCPDVLSLELPEIFAWSFCWKVEF